MSREPASNRTVALVIALVVIVWWVAIGPRFSSSKAEPTSTTRPAHHRVTQTTGAGSSLGASLGDALQHLFGGDSPTPPTTTRKDHR